MVTTVTVTGRSSKSTCESGIVTDIFLYLFQFDVSMITIFAEKKQNLQKNQKDAASDDGRLCYNNRTICLHILLRRVDRAGQRADKAAAASFFLFGFIFLPPLLARGFCQSVHFGFVLAFFLLKLDQLHTFVCRVPLHD